MPYHISHWEIKYLPNEIVQISYIYFLHIHYSDRKRWEAKCVIEYRGTWRTCLLNIGVAPAGKECDLNRQCGVLNPETKKICTRLLTCKVWRWMWACLLKNLERCGVGKSAVLYCEKSLSALSYTALAIKLPFKASKMKGLASLTATPGLQKFERWSFAHNDKETQWSFLMPGNAQQLCVWLVLQGIRAGPVYKS